MSLAGSPSIQILTRAAQGALTEDRLREKAAAEVEALYPVLEGLPGANDLRTNQGSRTSKPRCFSALR